MSERPVPEPEVSPIPEVVAALFPREKLIWAKASDILETPLSAEEKAMLDALRDRPTNSKVSQRFGEGHSTRAKAIWGAVMGSNKQSSANDAVSYTAVAHVLPLLFLPCCIGAQRVDGPTGAADFGRKS